MTTGDVMASIAIRNWRLHGKSRPSWWCFLRIFLTAINPSRRSIAAGKRKEKEKKKGPKKITKIEKPDAPFNGRFHTRGQTDHLDGQNVWHLSVWCEFMSYCCRLVGLDEQMVFPDGQISDNLFVEKFVRPIFTSGDLFVWDDLSVQTFCSSSSVKTTNVKL